MAGFFNFLREIDGLRVIGVGALRCNTKGVNC